MQDVVCEDRSHRTDSGRAVHLALRHLRHAPQERVVRGAAAAAHAAEPQVRPGPGPGPRPPSPGLPGEDRACSGGSAASTRRPAARLRRASAAACAPTCQSASSAAPRRGRCAWASRVAPSRAPMRERRRRTSAEARLPPRPSATNAHGTVPTSSSTTPTTAQPSIRSEPPRAPSSKSAFSISAVPMRLPPTLMTSSVRPWKVYDALRVAHSRVALQERRDAGRLEVLPPPRLVAAPRARPQTSRLPHGRCHAGERRAGLPRLPARRRRPIAASHPTRRPRRPRSTATATPTRLVAPHDRAGTAAPTRCRRARSPSSS